MSDKHGFNLKLEQYLLDELRPAEKAALEKELAQNASLRTELENLKNSNAAYYAKYPTIDTQKNSESQESWLSILLTPRLMGGLAFVALCLVAIVLFYPKNNAVKNEEIAKGNNNTIIAMNGNNTTNGVTLKGGKPALFLSTKQELANGAIVHAGDEIQIAYRASGYKYGVIFSVDATRSTTFHFPANFESGASQELRPGSRVPLQFAFKLDEKPGFEKFYFVAAQKPLSHPQLLVVASASGKVTMTDVEVTTILLKKE